MGFPQSGGVPVGSQRRGAEAKGMGNRSPYESEAMYKLVGLLVARCAPQVSQKNKIDRAVESLPESFPRGETLVDRGAIHSPFHQAGKRKALSLSDKIDKENPKTNLAPALYPRPFFSCYDANSSASLGQTSEMFSKMHNVFVGA